MKVFYLVVFWLFSNAYCCRPNVTKIPQVEGRVIAAVWCSGYSYHRLESGEEVVREIKVNDHWFIVFENVKGISKDFMNNISLSFVNGEPGDRVSKRVDPEKHLFIRIAGKKDDGWSVGSIVAMSDCVFEMDQLGGAFAAKKIQFKKRDVKQKSKTQPKPR